MTKIVKPQKISIKDHPGISEKFIQNYIADDPAVIGLGELVLKDKERMQPRAGRLDLLLMDPESSRRYEVEIQLGKTDESHVIRTIEYWDIERKRYPQYDHCAVIIAEDITSRFLNVINLFNGFIPLVAIQMNGYKYGEETGLIFTKILDEMQLGLIEDDEESAIEVLTNRDYWTRKVSAEVLKTADGILEIINEVHPGHHFQYRKGTMTVTKNDIRLPFILLRPRKKDHVVVPLKMPKSDEIDSFIENNELDSMPYNFRSSRYRLRVNLNDLTGAKREAIRKLISIAYEKYNE